jgi:hypothetical protein
VRRLSHPLLLEAFLVHFLGLIYDYRNVFEIIHILGPTASVRKRNFEFDERKRSLVQTSDMDTMRAEIIRNI